MSRPLTQNRAEPFEEIYAADKTDPGELEPPGTTRPHRYLPGAGALVIEVQARVCSETSVVSPLIELPSTALTVAAADEPGAVFEYPLANISTPASLPTPAVIQAPPSLTALVLLNPPPQKPVPPPMSVDDACQLLKVTLSSTWEVVEQARRSLVMLAHPPNFATSSPNKRAKALLEAARVNAAYLKLFTLRQGL